MVRAKRPSSANQLPIASAVRARRRRLGLTLQELARTSGLSAPFLSQVERGQATPSITSLLAIAQALQVDIHYFINPPPSSQIVRRAKSPEAIDTGSPVKYVRLSGGHPERQMEALLMSIPAGTKAPAAAREGEGVYYVLEGELNRMPGSVCCGCCGWGRQRYFDVLLAAHNRRHCADSQCQSQ